MPRKQRTPKVRRDEPATFEELELRARWGGFSGMPCLTPDQAEQFVRLRRARPDWHPQRALRFAWHRMDPIHGRGGRYYGGRPIRPDDPGFGDGWKLAGFLAALQQDAADIEDVILEHPEQRARLRDWLRRMEQVGRARDSDPQARAGIGNYYDMLSGLGYDATDLRADVSTKE